MSTIYHVYMVRMANGNLYTGISTDVQRRFAEHQHSPKGARALKGKGPLTLVFEKEIGEKGLALRVEYALKKLNKIQKEALILGSDEIINMILDRFSNS